MSDQFTPVQPFSVGEYLRDWLNAAELTTSDAALFLDGDHRENTLWLDLVACEHTWQDGRILFTPEDAQRLQVICGISATTWMRLHEAFLRAKARKP